MQEQNGQGVRLKGRENDEGDMGGTKTEDRIKEEDDAISRRGWFGAGFPNWSDRRPAAAGGEARGSLNESLTAQPPHVSVDITPEPAQPPHVSARRSLNESLTAQPPHVSVDITPEVATAGTSTAVAKLEADETWNKRLNGYVFFLGVALSMIFIIRPLLPHGYDCWMLPGFAMVWGLGSIGIPLGMFGTTRLEKNASRHIWRLVSLCFSLLVIYAIYLLAKPIDAGDAPAPGPSPSPLESDVDTGVTGLDAAFALIGLGVLFGYIFSWSMGCCYGGDRDLEPK